MIYRLILWFLLIVPCGAMAGAAITAQTPAPVFDRGELTILHQGGGKTKYKIEIATTPEQQAYGLMFRKTLPKDQGMIFVFDDRVVSMWMKNTFIPLTMLFVRADGVIVKMAAAQPLDLTPINSGIPIRYVVELGAEVIHLGRIQTGDRVSYIQK